MHWAVAQADDLMPDGSRVAWNPLIPCEYLPAGVVSNWAIEHRGNWPIHCAGLMIRTATLRAIGGWVGIPIDDDIAMVAALAELTAGYYEPTVTWLYRHHAEQTHNTVAWLARQNEGRQIGLQRVLALRQAGWRLDAFTRTRTLQADPNIALTGPLSPEKLRHQA